MNQKAMSVLHSLASVEQLALRASIAIPVHALLGIVDISVKLTLMSVYHSPVKTKAVASIM